MFTGIIRELGIVKGISGLGRLYRLSVKSDDVSVSADIGDSVAVNGVCLTVTGKEKVILHFDVMGETVKRTNLAKIKYGDKVNLEGALRAGQQIGGHFVSGHIDCAGKIKFIGNNAGDISIDITFPENYSKLVADKGSIALDGVSLTVGKAGKGTVTVYMIPHTLKMTTLGFKRPGDEVNIEFDMIGKYISNSFEKGRFS